MTEWDGVRERVEALGVLPGAMEVFGALGHAFRLEDPLSGGELAELEAQLGVGLPEDYRRFLLQVGAGGAGPAYGVFPVRRVEGRWRWEGDGVTLADLGSLARPFPVQRPSAEELDALMAERPDEETFDDITEFDRIYEAWDARMADLLWSPERTAGAIVLCHQGCALRDWLVVSGPERGHMWADDRVDDVDLSPSLHPDGRPVTFADWYLGWLEEATVTATAASGARR